MANCGDTKLTRLAELEAAATPGPWDVYEQPVKTRAEALEELRKLVDGTPTLCSPLPMLTSPGGLSPGVTSCGKDSLANARFIAAARNAIPAMLEEIRLLRTFKDRLPAICAAYVLDRAEQYNNGSGIRAAFDELIGQFRESEHLKAFDHGELDDILKRWGVTGGDEE